MGLYAIDCPQCGKAFGWFSGNLDQRCHECKNPRICWLPVGYQEDSKDTREGPDSAGPYIQVIDKAAFDAQCKETIRVANEFNALSARYQELLESCRNPNEKDGDDN